MNALLLLSMALLLAALAGSLALWIRTGETRAGLFGALFFLIAIHETVGIRNQWGTPFALDSSALGELAILAAGVLGILVVVALRRTVAEREAAYNDIPATDYASYQRVLCNKCHAKD